MFYQKAPKQKYTEQQLSRMASPDTPCVDSDGKPTLCLHRQVGTKGGKIYPNLENEEKWYQLIFCYDDFERHLKFMLPTEVHRTLCPVILAPFYKQFVKLFQSKEPVLFEFAKLFIRGENLTSLNPQLTNSEFMKAFMAEHRKNWKLLPKIVEAKAQVHEEWEVFKDRRLESRWSETVKQLELQTSNSETEIDSLKMRNNIQTSQVKFSEEAMVRFSKLSDASSTLISMDDDYRGRAVFLFEKLKEKEEQISKSESWNQDLIQKVNYLEQLADARKLQTDEVIRENLKLKIQLADAKMNQQQMADQLTSLKVINMLLEKDEKLLLEKVRNCELQKINRVNSACQTDVTRRTRGGY